MFSWNTNSKGKDSNRTCNWSVKRVSLGPTLLLNLVDLVDKTWIIAYAITKMEPPLVEN